MTQNTLSKVFLGGVFWEGLRKYSNYILNIIVTAILARLISPDDFGIIALVLAYNGFALIFTDSGINSAVVQRTELERSDLSTVFWFSLFVGSFIAAFTIIFSGRIATYFEMPELNLTLKLLCLDLIIVSLKAVPIRFLQREFRFSKLSIVDLISAILSSIFAIVLAYYGYGYLALVAKIISYSLVSVIPIFIISKFSPKLTFDYVILKNIFSTSALITGFKSINKIMTKFKIDLVIHLAAYTKSGINESEVKSNIDGNLLLTANLLEAILLNKVKKIINTSSYWELGQESSDQIKSPYAIL